MAIKFNCKRALILIALAVIFVAGILFSASLVATSGVNVFSLRPLSFILLGTALLVFTLIKGARHWMRFFFFLGTNILFFGVLYLFSFAKATPLHLRQLWPACVIFCGASLVPLSFYGNKKLLAKYLVPSIILMCLGLVSLIFSLKLIKQSFTLVFSHLVFVIIMLLIAIALALFFHQLKIRKDFPYITDEVDNFNDIEVDTEES